MLLGYPAGSVGRLMPPDFAKIRPEQTMSEALDAIPSQVSESETLREERLPQAVHEKDRRQRDAHAREEKLTVQSHWTAPWRRQSRQRHICAPARKWLRRFQFR
jgi:hypothetical protein